MPINNDGRCSGVPPTIDIAEPAGDALYMLVDTIDSVLRPANYPLLKFEAAFRHPFSVRSLSSFVIQTNFAAVEAVYYLHEPNTLTYSFHLGSTNCVLSVSAQHLGETYWMFRLGMSLTGVVRFALASVVSQELRATAKGILCV
jgi:hypothetical protein